MKKKTIIFLIILLCIFTNVYAKEYEQIEIFDVERECVVKTITSNSIIEKECLKYLKGITGVYGKANPIPKTGYMVKVQLEPTPVQNDIINAFVEQIIIVFPGNEKPYLMLLDSRDTLVFLTFEGNTKVILKNLNLRIK